MNGEVYFFGDLGKAIGALTGGLIIDATSKALVPQTDPRLRPAHEHGDSRRALLAARRMGSCGQRDA